MSRLAMLLAGLGAIVASYIAVVFGIAPEGLGPFTLASIALPALVAGFVMTAVIALQTRANRRTSGEVNELQKRLVRKEIEISRLSMIDELTGLYTRHHFDESIELEFKRTVRHGRPLALAIIEIDDLAELGGAMGSLSKGYVIAEVAAMLRQTLRINDIGCRFTNERLAVLFPETGAHDAEVVANKVRRCVLEREFNARQRDGALRLTVSQGIAVVPLDDITTEQELIGAAEAALTEARGAGYNELRIRAPHVTESDEADDSELLAS